MGNKFNKRKIKNENKEENKKEENKQKIPIEKEYIYEISNIDESKLKDEYKIVFLGRILTGIKTTLLSRLSGAEFIEDNLNYEIHSSVNIKINLNQKKKINFQLWETPSQENYIPLIKMFMKVHDCLVIGYDITKKYSFDEIKNMWYPKAIEFNACNLIYLIGNKLDLNENREVKKEEAFEFAKSNNLRFFEISCKTGEGMKEFLDDLVHNILKQ